ncbi:hypothetical protein M0804_009899 [Polistes exclamans]|nr:hypothetical protein M0804_009899 [Polistes exclamans]
MWPRPGSIRVAVADRCVAMTTLPPPVIQLPLPPTTDSSPPTHPPPPTPHTLTVSLSLLPYAITIPPLDV